MTKNASKSENSAKIALHIDIPGERELSIVKDETEHAILGKCDTIAIDGHPVTMISAIDWDDPAQIPAIDKPGTLPRGAGRFLLNELARRAKRPLHYRGPYPTPGLFLSLRHSFAARADGGEPEDVFTKDCWQHMMKGQMVSPDVAFHPTPFDIHWLTSDVVMLSRDEKTFCIFVGEFDFVADAREGLLSRQLASHSDGTSELVVKAGREILEVYGKIVNSKYQQVSALAINKRKPISDKLTAKVAELSAIALPQSLRQAVVAKLTPMHWDEIGPTSSQFESPGIAFHYALPKAFADNPEQLLAGMVHDATAIAWQVAAAGVAAKIDLSPPE